MEINTIILIAVLIIIDATLADIEGIAENNPKEASTEIWQSDPVEHKKGVTYEEVTRLLQGYVENEIDMNAERKCKKKCRSYTSTTNYGCYDEKEICTKQPKCNGNLIDCKYFTGNMDVCLAESSDSLRRYDFIQLSNGTTLGRNTSCSSGTIEVESWMKGKAECSYCICLCDERSYESDRYFSLRSSVADIENNMVMTGIKFTKENKVFHLKIQQGQLLPGRRINESTLSWKSVEAFNVYDKNIVKGQDVYILTAESRAIDIEDQNINHHSFVVTGARLRIVGTHLKLEIQMTEIDVDNGKVNTKNTFWRSNTHTRTEEIKLLNPDIPTNTNVDSLQNDSKKRTGFIKFTNTDYFKDAAQTTVPFLDVQEVITNPPATLSGLGIYHKVVDGYGGFIAPKLLAKPYA